MSIIYRIMLDEGILQLPGTPTIAITNEQIAFRSAWTIGAIILGLTFFPGLMIALVLFGLVIVALPILLVAGLVMFLVR